MATGDPPPGEEHLFTEQDVKALADKLEQWTQTLPVSEQALMALILENARAPERGEIEGYQAVTSLRSANLFSWLSLWVINRRVSYFSNLGNVAYVKDTGPSWSNDPRKTMGPGSIYIR
jgi:hypothetical protein